jgi:hypothetical protein
VLFVMIAGCGLLMLRAPVPAEAASEAEDAPPIAPGRFGMWVFIAAVPSGLLVAVTAHISTDIAAAPLLWVIPLSLYLLTFVLVFARRALLPHRLVMAIQPLALVGLIALMALPPSNYLLALAGHLAAFFVIALACHGELARQRPPSQRLTTFYLAMALGGMIGGLFAGLVAPNVFSWIAEYPILIVLAALCRPFQAMRLKPHWEWLMWGAIMVAAAVAIVPTTRGWLPQTQKTTDMLTYATIAIAFGGALLAYDPPTLAIAIAVALVMVRLSPTDEHHVHTARSFFGVYKVFDTADSRFRVLQNGSTIHGAQPLRDADGKPIESHPPKQLTYYAPGFGMEHTITAVRKRKGAPISVAIVGLGTATLTCYREPGDDWRIFEIDVVMIGLSRDSGLFDYLRDCAPQVPIVVGDARRMLAREPDGRFDVILLDAFSSDTIPIHLITRDAMAMFKRKLAPHGVVVMHVSNRYLELSSVVAGIAAANGLRSWESHGENGGADDYEYVFTSDVVIAAESAADIGELAESKDFVQSLPDPNQRVWTDDYCNIVGAVWRK